MTDFFPGYQGIVKMDDTGGTLRTFTGYVSDIDESYEQDIHATPVMGTKGKRKTYGQDDATITLEGPWHSQIEAWVGAPSTWGTKRTVEVYPEGETTGDRKRTGEYFIKSYNPPLSVDDAARFTIELEKDGDASWGTVS